MQRNFSSKGLKFGRNKSLDIVLDIFPRPHETMVFFFKKMEAFIFHKRLTSISPFAFSFITFHLAKVIIFKPNVSEIQGCN